MTLSVKQIMSTNRIFSKGEDGQHKYKSPAFWEQKE
jgi:hypothetical protein